MRLPSVPTTKTSAEGDSWEGRQIKEDKRGYINQRLPNILSRLSLPQQECLKLCTELEKSPRLWVGSTERLNLAKQQLKKQRMPGIHIC
ncbi:hypothetical protein [Vibrio spartinae]|uniref:Uncharacterized protein n=1 Tax=Vibrio spartinae TaxID=1918945 RepID=A0ABX6QXW3_9VIBR|nr:hypothetical protein [Vibrio spartinae]QMV13857.1 hypothetical protein Vspart_01102 [Vibrio spartinae]